MNRAVVCSLCLAALVALAVDAQTLELYEGDTCKQVAGVEWTCKEIKDCPKAQDDLKNGRRPERCSFGSNDEVIVCCQPSQTPSRPRPSETTDVPRPRPITIPSIPRRPPTSTRPPAQLNERFPQSGGNKSREMCRKYAQSVFLNTTSEFGQVLSFDQCAAGLQPLITNGTKAEPMEFPHMALIGFGEKNRIRWSCGGSVISERWVLSAAHCTYTGQDGTDSPKWVRLGEYNVHSTKDDDERIASPVDFDIIQLINHPQYDPKKLHNDIALYKLNRDVKFNQYIRPICLHAEYQIPKKQGLITGWGRIRLSEKQSDILLKGNVTFISGMECNQMLKEVKTDAEIRDDIMICAANFESGTDTCKGDSGGPLQYRLRDPYCMYSQIGVTSFGIGCASSFPGVYTRVSTFVPWIESIVWP